MNRSYAMRICIVILAAALTIISGRSYAVDWDGGKIDVMYRMDLKAKRIYGDRNAIPSDADEDRTWNILYSEYLALTLTHKTDGDLNVSGFVNLLHTDEEILMIGDEHFRLIEGTLTLRGERWSLELGDTYAPFTSYTFNRGFFGIKGEYNSPVGVDLILLGGVNRDSRLDRYERACYGVRLVAAPDRRLTLGASYVHAEITKLFYDSSETAYRNDVVSIDGMLSLYGGRLVLFGEGAMSLYLDDMRNPRSETVRDLAFRTNITLKPIRNDLTVYVFYEYVEPGFRAVMGTPAVDRETMDVIVVYTPSDRWECMGTYHFSRNGLTETSPVSFSAYDSEALVVVAYTLPNTGSEDITSVFSAGIYYLGSHSKDDPKSVNEEVFRLNLGAKHNRKHTEYEIKYIYEQYIDHLADSIDREKHSVKCIWRYHHTAFGFDYRIKCGMNMVYEIRLGPNSTDSTTDFELGADVVGEVTLRRFSPYNTTLLVECSGLVKDRRERANVREGELSVTLTQVLMKRRGLTAWIALEYEATHNRVSDGSGRYGERVGRMSFIMEF